MDTWFKSMTARIAALGVPAAPAAPARKVVTKVIKKKTVSKVSSKPKKSYIPEILMRGDCSSPVVISRHNREIKKGITGSQNKYLYVEVVGKYASNKVYLRLDLADCNHASTVEFYVNHWKLWKTRGLNEFMGTSEYELVVGKGYSLEWAATKANLMSLLRTEDVRVRGTTHSLFMLRLVQSTSVVKPVMNAECRVCKLPKSTFFKLDNMCAFVHNEECSKVFGECSDCVHVLKLNMKNPVVCLSCKKNVNVVGVAPGKCFIYKCFDCVVAEFYTV